MKFKYNRIFIVILDSVGCGVQKDYKKYHKEKSNTLLSVYKHNAKLRLPNLEKMGLKKILFNKNINGNYCAGKMSAKTAGNDTLAGVWEMMGVPLVKRFRSKERGLPKKILMQLEKKLHVPFVGNEYISGVKAINKFYNQHVLKKGPIIYFDKDGVALIAGHKQIVPPEELNAIGKKLGQLLLNQNIARVITRPFVGRPGSFVRKKGGYYAYATKPFFHQSVLHSLKKNNFRVVATQHISSLLSNPDNVKIIKDNFNSIRALKKIVTLAKKSSRPGVIITCLREFDMLGHYNDIVGYGQKLKEFDAYLPQLLAHLKADDLLIITADHGGDPAATARGHNREYVPLIIYNKSHKGKHWLGTRQTFADIGQTICRNFNLPALDCGQPIKEIF